MEAGQLNKNRDVVSMPPLKGLTAENRTAKNTRGLAFTGKSIPPPRPRYVVD